MCLFFPTRLSMLLASTGLSGLNSMLVVSGESVEMLRSGSIMGVREKGCRDILIDNSRVMDNCPLYVGKH